MKLLSWDKDGGPDSTVHGFWFCEFKSLFSIVLLKFANGSRDAYHSHTFHSISWLLKGKLVENLISGKVNTYGPSLWPILTTKHNTHKVVSEGTTWALSFRGPWSSTWSEVVNNQQYTLKHGRIKV
jgi:hypothetical protein